MVQSHCMRTGQGKVRGTRLGQWETTHLGLVPVPVSVTDQCEHFYLVLFVPFGPCASPVPLQCD